MFASFATPLKLVPRPAAIPATCVPCAQPEMVEAQLTPEPVSTDHPNPFPAAALRALRQTLAEALEETAL